MRLTWKERHRWCRWWRDRCALCQIPARTGRVINMAALHRRSQRGHLTCLSPAGHCTSSGQRHALLILAAELSWLVCQPSICSSPFSLWLIQDHGCCMFHPPDWLLWLWLAPHLTLSRFLDPHCPADPPWWYLTPLPGYHGPRCAVSSVWIIRSCQWAILPFVAHGDTFLTFIHAPPTSWSSFLKAWPFTCFSYSIFHTPDLSDLSVFCCHFLFPKERGSSSLIVSLRFPRLHFLCLFWP